MKRINIFNKKKITTTQNDNVAVELVTTEANGFFNWNGQLFKSDIIRSIIRPKATAIGKLDVKHARENENGLKLNPEPYMKFLLLEPNPLMSMQVLLEKMIWQLELNSNAFAVINYDTYGLPNSIYPIEATYVEAIYKNSVLWLRFQLKNGRAVEYPYSQIIHLRKDFYDDDIFGTPPTEALKLAMEVLTTTDQSLIHAVRNSNNLKWILKFKQVMKEKDVLREVNKFINNFMKVGATEGGAGATDPRYDAEQVKQDSYVPNAPTINIAMQRLYNFFNTNEKIVQSKFNENEWISYYEAEIEPVIKQLHDQYSRKLFNRTQRVHGNYILFDSMSLSFASMSTKLALRGHVESSILSRNEVRKIMNFPPIEGGDEMILRKDTGFVKEAQEDDLKGGEDNEQKQTEGNTQ